MLVVVEHATKAGFSAVMEARNFLLQISKKQLDPLSKHDDKSKHISQNVSQPEGSVVAPVGNNIILQYH